VKKRKQSRGCPAGQDEVNLMAVGTVESDVELALEWPYRVVLPAGPMNLRDALHGDDQLQSHEADSGRRPMPSLRSPTALAGSPRLGLWATIASPASASDW